MHKSHLLVILLFAGLLMPAALADSHQLSFTNNCNQDVWVNVQGGPPGICDNNYEDDGVTHIQCSACAPCKDGSLCNTSVTTGAPKPMCCRSRSWA